MNEAGQDTLPPGSTRARQRADFDALEAIFEDRHDIRVGELVELAKWAREERRRRERYAQAGAVAIIGLIAMGIMTLLTEGVRWWITHLRP